MDIILLIRLYSLKLNVCRTLDPTACSKVSSEKHVWGRRTAFYLQPCDLYKFARWAGCILPAYLDVGHWGIQRSAHNYLVLDVQLKLIQTSQLWNLLRLSILTYKLTLLQSSNGAPFHELAFNLIQVCTVC